MHIIGKRIAKPSPACASPVQVGSAEPPRAIYSAGFQDNEVFCADAVSIKLSWRRKIRLPDVVQRIESYTNTCVIFFLHFLAEYCAGFCATNVIWITIPAIPGKLAISGGNRRECNHSMWFSAWRRFLPTNRAIRKIFSKIARRISACLALSGRAWPALSRIKAAPPIIPSETIRSRAG